MKKLPLSILASFTAVTLLVSCGKDSSNSSSKKEDVTAEREEEAVLDLPPDGSNIDGTYMAKFITLNPHVNGTIPGSATIKRDGDRVYAYVRLFAGAPKAWHMQNIYLGNRCPDMSDDLNGDGYIDINEGNQVWGKIIIPLDANISSQRAGRNFYPLGDLSGSYYYERVTNFRNLFQDLQAEDKDLEDNVAKIEPGQGLSIEGRVVVIQGTAESVVYPPTVGTYGRYKPFQTLPIACGVFKKVTEMPGKPDDGVIPGPIAEVVPGQDRPAEDTPVDDTTETAGTAGTNDANEGAAATSNGGVNSPTPSSRSPEEEATRSASGTTPERPERPERSRPTPAPAPIPSGNEEPETNLGREETASESEENPSPAVEPEVTA